MQRFSGGLVIPRIRAPGSDVVNRKDKFTLPSLGCCSTDLSTPKLPCRVLPSTNLHSRRATLQDGDVDGAGSILR